jgi:ribosomal protein S18 acetylase RimI-like enzyme
VIKVIDHTNSNAAIAIRLVFQVSYTIEAKLLNAVNFPPLQRQLTAFTNCKNTFYGYYVEDTLAAVTEIKHDNTVTHIQSLVVDPKFFRQGIAQKIIDFVFKTYNSPLFSVETGADNLPACKLYEKMGFIETCKWMTEHDIVKVRYEKVITAN